MPSANSRVAIVNEGGKKKTNLSTRGLKDVLSIEVIDENGDQITEFGGSGYEIVGIKNVAGDQKNPSTEDKQDDIKTAIDNKELKGNTQPDGSGTPYHIVTDSSGRLHTRSFRNAAGDGRRMLVDSDRHGQVDVLSSIDKPFTTLIDDHTTANKTYIGKAVAGANEGALVWQIKCLDETGNFLKIGFADGVSTFTKEWDNRVGYTYN